jgi:hypothetical protein
MKRLNVVTLRRPESNRSGDSESSVEWSHRWLVNGHWRNQWYPSLETHRLIWVNPHVKGPPDKELVLKGRVHIWEK